MSVIDFNISAESLDNLLNIKLASGWKKELLHDVANVGFNKGQNCLGFTVTVLVDSFAGNSYSVSEYISFPDGSDFDDIHNVLTIEEAVKRIEERASYWMEVVR